MLSLGAVMLNWQTALNRRYYITTQGPRVHQLFEQCTPSNISGLFWNENGNKGWSGTYYAHGILMRTGLFMSLHVSYPPA